MDATKYTLGPYDLAKINAARSAVKAAFSDRPENAPDGMLYALAEAYNDAAFRLLNWSKHNGVMDIPDDVLHNRT